MNQICFTNVIPLNIIEELVSFFNTNTHLHYSRLGAGTTKIEKPWPLVKDLIDPYLSKYFNTEPALGGNFYKHEWDYGPHVDSSDEFQTINCLLPLVVPSVEQQHFVIFDQYVEPGIGRTWMCGAKNNNGELEKNFKTLLYPWEDTSVQEKVQHFDENFYNKYLKHNRTSTETYRSLSGTAYEYTPGNLILFNSNQVHTTGRMVAPWKLGLFIQFKGSLSELIK